MQVLHNRQQLPRSRLPRLVTALFPLLLLWLLFVLRLV
jgi:hypothetical protein